MIISQHGIAFTRNGIVTHASASFQRFLASTQTFLGVRHALTPKNVCVGG